MEFMDLEYMDSLEESHNAQIDIYEMRMFCIEQETLILDELGMDSFGIIQEGVMDKILTACKNIIQKIIDFIKRMIEQVQRRIQNFKDTKGMSIQDKALIDMYSKLALRHPDFKLQYVKCTNKGIDYVENYKSAYSNKTVDLFFDAMEEIISFFKDKKYQYLQNEDLDDDDKMTYVFRECPDYNNLMKKCNYDITKFKSMLVEEIKIIEDDKRDEYISIGGECTVREYQDYAVNNHKLINAVDNDFSHLFIDFHRQFYIRKLQSMQTKIDRISNNHDIPSSSKLGSGLYKLLECINYCVMKNAENFSLCINARNKCVQNINAVFYKLNPRYKAE